MRFNSFDGWWIMRLSRGNIVNLVLISGFSILTGCVSVEVSVNSDGDNGQRSGDSSAPPAATSAPAADSGSGSGTGNSGASGSLDSGGSGNTASGGGATNPGQGGSSGGGSSGSFNLRGRVGALLDLLIPSAMAAESPCLNDLNGEAPSTQRYAALVQTDARSKRHSVLCTVTVSDDDSSFEFKLVEPLAKPARVVILSSKVPALNKVTGELAESNRVLTVDPATLSAASDPANVELDLVTLATTVASAPMLAILEDVEGRFDRLKEKLKPDGLPDLLARSMGYANFATFEKRLALGLKSVDQSAAPLAQKEGEDGLLSEGLALQLAEFAHLKEMLSLPVAALQKQADAEEALSKGDAPDPNKQFSEALMEWTKEVSNSGELNELIGAQEEMLRGLRWLSNFWDVQLTRSIDETRAPSESEDRSVAREAAEEVGTESVEQVELRRVADQLDDEALEKMRVDVLAIRRNLIDGDGGILMGLIEQISQKYASFVNQGFEKESISVAADRMMRLVYNALRRGPQERGGLFAGSLRDGLEETWRKVLSEQLAELGAKPDPLIDAQGWLLADPALARVAGKLGGLAGSYLYPQANQYGMVTKSLEYLGQVEKVTGIFHERLMGERQEPMDAGYWLVITQALRLGMTVSSDESGDVSAESEYQTKGIVANDRNGNTSQVTR